MAVTVLVWVIRCRIFSVQAACFAWLAGPGKGLRQHRLDPVQSSVQFGFLLVCFLFDEIAGHGSGQDTDQPDSGKHEYYGHAAAAG